MPTERADKHLIEEVQRGHIEATEQLYQRYYQRLVELARRQMNWRLRGVEGSSDLVQSVLRSVFELIREERVQLPEDGDLWPLLVRIALNKIRNKAKYWKRERRDQNRLSSLSGIDAVQKEPTPEDVAALDETVKELFAHFSDRRQAVLSRLLQDYKVGEIAAELGISERTVYNTRMAAAEVLRELIMTQSSQ
jgi:RNA polymerase sigma factor (sigma-70 family)